MLTVSCATAAGAYRGVLSTNGPTRSEVVAVAAAASAGSGESVPRVSGTSRLVKPRSSARRAVAAQALAVGASAATTPNRNDRVDIRLS